LVPSKQTSVSSAPQSESKRIPVVTNRLEAQASAAIEHPERTAPTIAKVSPAEQVSEKKAETPQDQHNRQEPGLSARPSHSESESIDRVAPSAPTSSNKSPFNEASAEPNYKAAPNFASKPQAASAKNNVEPESHSQNESQNEKHMVSSEVLLEKTKAQPESDNMASISSSLNQPTFGESDGDEEDDENLRLPQASEAEWAGFVELLSLNGLVKEFAMNMACDNINTQPMTLLLDPNFQYMQNPAREESIKKEIRKQKGDDWQVNIIVSKTVQETPSERINRLSNDKRRDTKEDIKNDSTVQSVMNTLGMDIDESSIKLK